MDPPPNRRTKMRIYYTGDMANQSGWFRAEPDTTSSQALYGSLLLREEDGPRTFTVLRRHIGEVYAGHCNPRFVTEDAYQTYYRERTEAFRAATTA
jgi:hypothetical protein